jgi:hypothetical protein
VHCRAVQLCRGGPQSWLTFTIIDYFEVLHPEEWLPSPFEDMADLEQIFTLIFYKALLFWSSSVIRYALTRAFLITFSIFCTTLLCCFQFTEMHSVFIHIQTTILAEAILVLIQQRHYINVCWSYHAYNYLKTSQ